MNKNSEWFVPKRYGYGYFPVTWQGWISVILILAFLTAIAYVSNFFTSQGPTTQEGFRYLIDLVLFLFAIDPFMKSKTRGTVKWNWGKI